jgi:hypothetical protein
MVLSGAKEPERLEGSLRSLQELYPEPSFELSED